MTIIRRRLRFWVAAWLVFQAGSLSALVPRECCMAHRPEAASKHGCDDQHEQNEQNDRAAVVQCPMRAADGTPCPVHRHGDSDARQKARDRCSMRGTCDRPVSAFLALLSNHGVLTDSFAMSPDLHRDSITIHIRENLITRLASPGSPPPRS
jgi:hypothetical protein